LAKIAVVGAGPAGVIVGNYLISQGFNVTLFEEKKETISTPCGEGISHRTVEKLEKDTDFDSSLFISREVKGLKNFFPGYYHVFIHKKGYVLNRQDWLKGLQNHFQKNGGKIVFNKKISSLKGIQSDFFVAADGPNSFIRKQINAKVEVVPACQYKMVLDHPQRDYVEFCWDKQVSQFYAWNFPKANNQFNVGTMGNFSQLNDFIKKYGLKGRIEKKEAYPITFNGKGIQKENILLIGDAAGMANPFSKGGLAPIVYASEILTKCLKENTAEEYEKKIYEHPAFSHEFYQLYRIICKLSQEELRAIGSVAHGFDLFKMPLTAKLRVLTHPLLINNFLKLYSGFKKGIELAW